MTHTPSERLLHWEDLSPLEFVAIQKDVAKLEATNTELLEALEATLGVVEFFAGAIDSDHEDRELLELVSKVIKKARKP